MALGVVCANLEHAKPLEDLRKETPMSDLQRDSGEPLVLRSAPSEGVEGYTAIPMIWVGPAGPDTSTT